MSGPPAGATVGVPFVDLDRVHAPIAGELREALARVLERGDFILGAEVDAFEEELAAYLGLESGGAVGVGSGTAALQIAARALGLGPGDEVIVPAHTYVATALGLRHAGAEPILCDVSDATGLIDLDSAERVVGERTAAIAPVHLYGQPCDMDAVGAFAARHGLAVIEDAAQAHGAGWRGRRCGSLGDVACFSFYPAKNLGALGDAGMVTSPDPAVADAARRYRNLGQLRKGEHEVAGYNERLDTIQAAALRVKLRHLEAANEDRRRAAARYREGLPGTVATTPARPGAEEVHHLFPVRVSDRDRLAAGLAERGIGTGVHYSPALHLQPPLAGTSPRVPLPVAEAWATEELSVPIFAGITDREVDAVIAAVEASL